MKTVGEIIRKKRKAIEVKEGELAQEIGVSLNTISRWEKGETYPTLMNAIAIADFFDCTIDELVGRIKSEQ